MELEQRNPEYAFLFNISSPGHLYYRCGWRPETIHILTSTCVLP
jgi:hypothetical protein